MGTAGSAWYVDFFRTDYLGVYGHLFNAERAAKEAAFAVQVLKLEPGFKVLDLCCGQGRHCVALARHGLRVTGVDLNFGYLELTRKAANNAHLTVECVAADMRNIPFHNIFDAAVNMYSSFGYLESEADDSRVLESLNLALRPGGRVLLDLLNREWAVANYIQNDWHSADDGTLYVERRELDLASSRMRVRFTIVAADGLRRESIGHDIRLYTLTETTRMLERANMSVTEVYGGFDGEPYSIDTRRMILVARKN